MIIATAGHVDHGKTSLVRALTGQETDRTQEERRRGMSIELGYAWLHLSGGRTLDLVDVPGHARFMRTLVAGVGAVDAVMLVVAADDGVMPQTLEHLQLISLLRLPLALVVLTKCSRATPQRIAEVTAAVQRHAAELKLAAAPVCVVDSLTDAGLPALQAELERLPPGRAATDPLCTRLLIDRHFAVPGIGQVITGTLTQGHIRTGDQLVLSDCGARVRVRGLQIHGAAVDQASAGQRCALNLVGELPARIERGAQLLEPTVFATTRRMDIELEPICGGLPRQLQVHVNGAVVNARLVPLFSADSRRFQAVLSEPLVCRSGDRLVLRDPAGQRLLAGGRVLDPFAPDKGRHLPIRRLTLDALSESTPEQQLRRLIAELPEMLDLQWFQRSTQFTRQALDDALERLESTEPLIRSGLLVCPRSRIAGVCVKLVETTSQYHQREPGWRGIELGRLAREVGLSSASGLLRCALRQCLDEKTLTQRGARFALPDFQPKPDPERLRWLARLEPDFNAAEPRPPVLGDIMQRLGLEREPLLEELEQLSATAMLVRVARNRYLKPDTLERLADLARQLTAANPETGFTTAEFRDLSGVGRNHSVAILECMDRAGLTRRLAGDRRLAL
jgi:selenocysteine-specific elongation factor